MDAVEPIQYFLGTPTIIYQNRLIFKRGLTSKVPNSPNLILLLIASVQVVDHGRNLQYPSVYFILEEVEVDVPAIGEANGLLVREYVLHELLRY